MPAGRRLADSHLACPTSMHTFGPPPFPRTSTLSARQAKGQAHFSVRTITPAQLLWGHGPGGSVATSACARVGRAAPGPRLPGDAAAPAGTRGGGPAGSRDPGRDRRPGAADGPRRQHLHHLPDPGTARADRHGHPHPSRARGADLPPGHPRRPRAPGLRGLRAGERDRPGRGPAADHRAGRAARLRDRRRPPDRLRPLRRLPDGERHMSEKPSPLLESPGAVQAGWPDEGVAAHYGDPMREQRALETQAGLVDRSNRGVLTITGQDRLSWLHSLTTQHLERLAVGESAQALILSPTGHVEHHLTLTDDGTSVWLHVEPGTADGLVAFLESMRFMLRVEVADVSRDYAVLTVLGPRAGELAAELEGVRARVDPGSFGSIDLIVARDRLPDTAAELVRRAGGEQGTLAGMWAYEALRIAARVPRFGLDTDHRTIPHEVGWIDTAVHLTKGCYRGQETVARVHNLGHPPRRLVFLNLDGSVDRLPAHGDPVDLDGTTVGFTGSAARHYELGPIGLALVKRTVPVEATLLAGGVAAAQEVVVPPDAGANVKVTLRRRNLI